MSEGGTRGLPQSSKLVEQSHECGGWCRGKGGWKFSADPPHSASIVSMLLYQTGLRSMSYSLMKDTLIEMLKEWSHPSIMRALHTIHL